MSKPSILKAFNAGAIKIEIILHRVVKENQSYFVLKIFNYT